MIEGLVYNRLFPSLWSLVGGIELGRQSGSGRLWRKCELKEDPGDQSLV